MIWVKLLKLVVVLLLVNRSSAQYKYVFYDGDEAEYYGSEVNSSMCMRKLQSREIRTNSTKARIQTPQ
jgi:hypothetical protein